MAMPLPGGSEGRGVKAPAPKPGMAATGDGRSACAAVPAPPRLPDGSSFRVRYDAARECWRGTLNVGSTTFAGESRSVFGLLTKLDGMYRKGSYNRTREDGHEAAGK